MLTLACALGAQLLKALDGNRCMQAFNNILAGSWRSDERTDCSSQLASKLRCQDHKHGNVCGICSRTEKAVIKQGNVAQGSMAVCKRMTGKRKQLKLCQPWRAIAGRLAALCRYALPARRRLHVACTEPFNALNQTVITKMISTVLGRALLDDAACLDQFSFA